MIFFEKLNPDLLHALNPEWAKCAEESEREPFHSWEIIYMQSSLETALHYSEFFFPELIEVEGSVFFKQSFENASEIYWALKEQKADRTQIEMSVNHFHVWDFFGEHAPHEEAYVHFAKRLRYIWSTHLKAAYPQRDFQFIYSNSEDDYGPTLYFHELI